MHDIHVGVTSPEATDHGVDEHWAADELIGLHGLAHALSRVSACSERPTDACIP